MYPASVIDCCYCGYVQIRGNLVQYYNIMFMNGNYYLGCLYDAGLKLKPVGI